MLNRDAENNEVDIYNVSSHKGLKGELDANLLTESGRNQIAQDLLKSGMIVDTIKQIVTNETVGVTDFFSNTAKENTTFEAIKEKIANDPALAKALSNPDLNPEQKEQMMNGITDAVMIELGYKEHDNKLIATDEKGRDNKDIKGYHSLQTETSYINEANIENGNEGLVEVAGTEAQRSIDRQEGSTFNQSQSYRDDRSDFSQNVGSNIATYTNFALSSTGQSSMTNYKKARVTTTPSIFNTVAANNAEFAGLDKSQGDNRRIEKVSYYGQKKGRFTSLERNVKVSYETTKPEMFSRALGNPNFREKVKTQVLNAASVGVAVAGAFSTGGLSYGLYTVGAGLDVYSVYKKNDFTYGLGSMAVPESGKLGKAWSVGNSINNSYFRGN